ncbi:hypothetical protein FB45DRAFT_1026228 [Roridomyces roridus]|uniref:Uncharacterized protein n=1 Tax=Roridomyces roridus TaxID=1738132 RepID=A0AAD7FPE9_9AGAR|nr:hypothetical protein FB45DRAFT_1026228 [Roridomyces roridus]
MSNHSTSNSSQPSVCVCHGLTGNEGCTLVVHDEPGFFPAHWEQGKWLTRSWSSQLAREHHTVACGRCMGNLQKQSRFCMQPLNDKVFCSNHEKQGVGCGQVGRATETESPQRTIIPVEGEESREHAWTATDSNSDSDSDSDEQAPPYQTQEATPSIIQRLWHWFSDGQQSQEQQAVLVSHSSSTRASTMAAVDDSWIAREFQCSICFDICTIPVMRDAVQSSLLQNLHRPLVIGGREGYLSILPA